MNLIKLVATSHLTLLNFASLESSIAANLSYFIILQCHIYVIIQDI